MGDRAFRWLAGRWLAGVAIVLLGACAPPAEMPVGPVGAAREAQYVIGPGDSLSIFVYQTPDLSTELPVRPDGRISLPLVPDLEAAGRTPTELARSIEERLRRYVRDPNVTVMVRSFVGQPNRQIRVIGEATQPLALPFREGMTLLDVMISARGLTRYAAGNRAEIVRREHADRPPQVIPVRLSSLLRDGDISQDIAMRPGDTLVIPQSWF